MDERRASDGSQIGLSTDGSKTIITPRIPVDVCEAKNNNNEAGVSVSKIVEPDSTVVAPVQPDIRADTKPLAGDGNVFLPKDNDSQCRHFDWEPVRKKGIEGFVEYAANNGFLGKTCSELREKAPAYYSAFRSWNRTEPKEKQQENRNRIYLSAKSFDWEPVRKKGIEGFVEYAANNGFLGKTFSEVKEKDKSFVSTFYRYLRTVPEEKDRERYSSMIYSTVYKDTHNYWTSIRKKGIEGFVEYAANNGFLGKTDSEVHTEYGGFYSAFNEFLGTVSEEKDREAYRFMVFKKTRFNWTSIEKKGITGFIEYAANNCFLGKRPKEVEREHKGFYIALNKFLRKMPEEDRETYRNQIYGQVEPERMDLEISRNLEISVNKDFLSKCAQVFGHSNLVDIFYAANPQFKSVDRREIKNYLAEYLGDFLINRPSFELDKFLSEEKGGEMVLKLLQEPDIYQAFLLNFKQECLHFYNQGKRDGTLIKDDDVFDYLERILSRLEDVAKVDETGNFKQISNRIFLDITGYYLRLSELAKAKPLEIVEFLGKNERGREFPDFSQRINILEFLNERRILVADEMGMGKTASAILAKEYLEKQTGRKFPVLVIVPKSVVGQWRSHLGQKKNELDSKACFVYDESRPQFGKRKVLDLTNGGTSWSEIENFADYDYVLVSQEILSIREKFEQLRKTAFPVLIADEMHLLKNTTQGKRANNFLELIDSFSKNPDNYFIGLSGTPLPNTVRDIAIYLQALYPDKFHPKENQSLDQYNKELVSQIIKTDNLDLRAILMPRMQIKSLGESVEMPGMKSELIPYQLPTRIQLIYESLLENDEVTVSEKIVGLRKFLMDPGLIKTLPGLEKVKIEGINKLLSEIYNNQEKRKAVMFFSGLMEGVLRGDDNIKDKLEIPEGVEILTIHGETKDDERQVIQSRFQNENKKFLLLVNSSVSGVGIDLSAGEAVIHFNEPWTMAEKRQCLARVYRPGQTQEVIEYTPYVENTIEEGIHKYICLKETIINKILQGIPLTEIERTHISDSENMLDGNSQKDMTENISGYLISDFSRLLRMFSANKGVGEEQFHGFLERYADEYASLYRRLVDYSYQANGNRIVGHLMGSLIERRGQDTDNLQIVDLASGPRMLWRHSPTEWQSKIRSMDLNKSHFVELDEKFDIGSMQNTPYESSSLDYVNLSFALHYTEFVPSKGKFERLDVFKELNRIVKKDGVVFINQIYSQTIENINNFRLLMKSLGFELLENYSGNLVSGNGVMPNFASTLITLKKVTDLGDIDTEDLFSMVNGTEIDQNELGTRKLTDALKFKQSGTKSLKRQRNVVDGYVLTSFDNQQFEGSVDFNQRDKLLYQQQQRSQLEVQEMLINNQGEIKNIDEEELVRGKYIRYRMGGKYYLLKVVETEFGESLLFM